MKHGKFSSEPFDFRPQKTPIPIVLFVDELSDDDETGFVKNQDLIEHNLSVCKELIARNPFQSKEIFSAGRYMILMNDEEDKESEYYNNGLPVMMIGDLKKSAEDAAAFNEKGAFDAEEDKRLFFEVFINYIEDYDDCYNEVMLVRYGKKHKPITEPVPPMPDPL